MGNLRKERILAKRYVILDTSLNSFGNDDFLLLGLKTKGFAAGCPMLFGGTSDPKDGPPDSKEFSMNVIRRELTEETIGHIQLNSAQRFHIYDDDLIVFASSDFTFDGRVQIGGEFSWIRKVSKGGLAREVPRSATRDGFAQILYGMTQDLEQPAPPKAFGEYLQSHSLDAVFKYFEKHRR
jgi:hypothetical protein